MLLLLAEVHAACSVTTTPIEAGQLVEVVAVTEPVHCRTLTLSADGPMEVRAERVDRYGRRHRLRGDHLLAVPGGGWKLGAPELTVGDALRVEVATKGTLEVALSDRPDPLPRGAWVDLTWEVRLDGRRPAWGFADPRLASTAVEARVLVFEDAGTVPYAVPVDAEGVVVDPAAPVSRGRVDLPAGQTTILRWTEPGADPLVVLPLAPGSLTVRIPAARLATSASPGVSVRELPGGVRFEAPTGGVARWRVERVGPDAVVRDAALYARGLDWRFGRVSLPEPAVPVRLKGLRDPEELLAALWGELRARVDASLPGADPLRPRPLNRAWKSGWATSVEKALILQRLLAQERIPSTWALTGLQADRVTLTGYDRMMLVATVAGTERWLDPACATCAPGEVDPRWAGRPAFGARAEVPRGPGSLDLTHELGSTPPVHRCVARGEARRWLLAIAGDAEPEHAGAVLGRAVGLDTARLVDRQDAEGTLTLRWEGDPTPGALGFAGEVTPWEGPAEVVVVGAPAP